MEALERFAYGKHCIINIHPVLAKVVSFSVSVSSKSSSLPSLSREPSGCLSAYDENYLIPVLTSGKNKTLCLLEILFATDARCRGQWHSSTFLTGGGGCNIGGFTDEVIGGEVIRLMELGGLGACPLGEFGSMPPPPKKNLYF